MGGAPPARAMAHLTGKRLDDAQLAELVQLLPEVDSVELKLTVPEATQRAAVQGLGMDALDAQIRQVFFFDTPDLALDHAGVVVRARRIQGAAHDSVVKLRPVVPDALSDDVRRSSSFGVEVDAMPGGFVCSASFKGKLDQAIVSEAVSGRARLRKLFSKEQRAFYAAHAPEGLELDELSVLGPIFVLKLKFTPQGSPRKLVAEMWLYPDGARILELSTKCPPADAFQAAAETRAYLAGRGLELSGEQQTKTRTALEFFARELSAEAAP